MVNVDKKTLQQHKSRSRVPKPVTAALLALVASLVFLVCLPREAMDERHKAIRPTSRSCPDYGCPLYPISVDNLSLDNLGASLNDTAAAATRTTNQNHPNQDRAIIIESFLGREDCFLVGLFDGHGKEGHFVADQIVQALPLRLAEKLAASDAQLADDDWIRRQLIAAFVEVDQELPPSALRGGATASVTLRLGRKLYIANAGDSQTMILTPNDDSASATIVYRTRKDKAHLPDERARIEGLGGTVRVPDKDPTDSHVIVYSAAAIPPEPIALAMSRSLGDWEWKAIGVTAEPLVDVVELPSGVDTFVLAASDGVWDEKAKHPEIITDLLIHRLGSLEEACIKVIRDFSPANPHWYRDDMTIAVVQAKV